MSSLERAISGAKWYKRYRNRPLNIYRVGPAWMSTTQTQCETQAKYKVPVKDFYTIDEFLAKYDKVERV